MAADGAQALAREVLSGAGTSPANAAHVADTIMAAQAAGGALAGWKAPAEAAHRHGDPADDRTRARAFEA